MLLNLSLATVYNHPPKTVFLNFMYINKSPQLLKSVVSDAIWEIETDQKELYLTFDDGPHEEVTPLVLEILKKYRAQATFFCVGENILKNPEIFQRLLDEGHQVGNHTFSHNNGWKNQTTDYLRSYLKCQELTKTNLFRPPYGRISPKQYQLIKKKTKIIMWTVLSGDFDASNSTEQCVKNVFSGIKNGSIIVFHDSQKAKERVLNALPLVLKKLSEQGYKFRIL